MRDLKFRGRTINGKWVYGDVALSGVAPNCVFISNLEGTFQVIPTTVGQYTGLKDKNGKEIYEGDLVKFSNNVIHEGVICECKYNSKLAQFIYVFRTGQNKDKATDMADDWREYEVIGNIHENPELLTHPAEGRN